MAPPSSFSPPSPPSPLPPPSSRVGHGPSPPARRLPPRLLALLLVICAASLVAPPAGRTSWALEVGPGLALVAWQVATYRRMPLSDLVYVGTFVHVLVLVYGGMHTYAATPLGNWARDTFHLARNHYDRVGHLALGLFPALLAREVLLRKTPLRPGGWLAFLAFSVVFSFGAFWELLEWWTTLVVASDVGEAFLGSQGDVWDAQWDMFLVGVGAALALATLGRVHDASMARVALPPAGGRAAGQSPGENVMG